MSGATTPKLVQKRGIDITPYFHAIWCSVGDSEPFANVIEHRSWSDDGSAIWLMLGTHNFYKCAPDEMVEVVECEPAHCPEFYAGFLARDAERMAKRPVSATPCPTCGHHPAGEKGGAR